MNKTQAYHAKKHAARVERKAAKRKQTRKPYTPPRSQLPSLPEMLMSQAALLQLLNRASNPYSYRRAA